MANIMKVVEILGSITPTEYWEMSKVWKAFIEDPGKFKDTNTEKLIRLWLAAFRAEHHEKFTIGNIDWIQYYKYVTEKVEPWIEEYFMNKMLDEIKVRVS